MANIRHTVIVRKDLNFSAGLLSAQVAHISDQFMRECVNDGGELTPIEQAWCKEPYLSVLGIGTKDELEMIVTRAKDANLSTYHWYDTVPCPTLSGEIMKTLVGISIGPDDFDKIKIITGNLSPY